MKQSEIPNLKSSGFTLFEVMLSLALTTLVMVAVTMAIDIHLRLLDSGRTKVEEAQLARALLGLIADDLRSAVAYRPTESAGLPSSATDLLSEGLENVAGAMGSMDGIDGLAQEDFDTLQDAAPELNDYVSDLSDSSASSPKPGLYGNHYQLQVDTSRLPRADQYNGMLLADGTVSVADLVSDVKTVTYYVIEDLQGSLGYSSSDGLQDEYGLVRHERARATASYAAESGQLSETESQQEVIAPEVAAIEFLYFDGTEWVEEWNGAERGGLPVAVDIAIAIIPVRSRNTKAASWQITTTATASGDEDLLVYRLLVHLPAAEPTTSSTEETSDFLDESESMDDFDTSSDSTGGTSGR